MNDRVRSSWRALWSPVLLLLFVGIAWSESEPSNETHPDDPALTPASAFETTIQSPQPWIIEGDSLWGTRDTGTKILSPRIRHEGLRIRADHGRVNRDRSVLVLISHVRIEDSLRVVTSDEGTYRRPQRVLDLIGSVRGSGPEGEFAASDLHYDRNSGTIVLRGGPELRDSSRVIRANKIVFESDADVGEAIGQVRILMEADSTWFNGEHATYDRKTGEMVLTGDPWLYRPGTGRIDDLTVFADTLRMNEFDRKGWAVGNVRIEQGQVQATSGRALFELARNRTTLYDQPVARDLDGEIRADTLAIRIRPQRDDLLEAFGNVTVDYSPRLNPGERNIVAGDTLRASLVGGTVQSLSMLGTAASLYFPSLDDARRGTGRNLSQGQRIDLEIKEGQARRVDMIGMAEGTYRYPGVAALQDLRNPAFLDSIMPNRALSRLDELDPGNIALLDSLGTSPSDTGSVDVSEEVTVPGLETEKPEVRGKTLAAGDPDPLLTFFGEMRTLDFPESLATPLDGLFGEEVVYGGDTIRFHVADDLLSIRGRGRMEYQSNALESEEIDYFASRDFVVATGEPTLKDGKSEVLGHRMTYRTDELQGFVYQGKTEFDGGYYYGEQIKKLPSDDLLVKSGIYTTCESDPPHFHFKSSRMKMSMDDKVVARPVILHIRNVPVFAIPYYFFPIHGGRQSGLLVPDFEFGFTADRGRFIRNLGYYWAINDYMDAKGWFDYFDNGPQWQLNGDYRYKVRYLLDGSVSGAYVDEKNGDEKSKRWRFQGSHTQRFYDESQLKVRANFTSDATFTEEYDPGAGVDERLNRQLDSSADYSKGWTWGSTSLRVQRTQFLDQETDVDREIVEQLPYIDLRLSSFPIGRRPDELGRGGFLPAASSIVFSPRFRFRRSVVNFWDGAVEDESAADFAWSLSDNRSLGPYLRFSPGLSGSGAWFRHDEQGKSHQFGATWRASLGAQTTLYGTFPWRLGALDGVRHVVEPSVSYSYTPELENLTYVDADGEKQPQFGSVGGISLSSGKKASGMSFSLRQGFHAKFRAGEEVIKKENVLTWRMSSSYNFLAEEPSKKLSNITNDFRVRPLNPVDITYRNTIDPHVWETVGYSVTAGAAISSQTFSRSAAARDSSRQQTLEYGEFGEADIRGADIGNRDAERVYETVSTTWNLRADYSYSGGGFSGVTNTGNLRLDLSPSRGWRTTGSVYYDLEKKDLISHSLSLSRDIHCWEFWFEYRSTGTYRFKINIKGIDDVKYDITRG